MLLRRSGRAGSPLGFDRRPAGSRKSVFPRLSGRPQQALLAPSRVFRRQTAKDRRCRTLFQKGCSPLKCHRYREAGYRPDRGAPGERHSCRGKHAQRQTRRCDLFHAVLGHKQSREMSPRWRSRSRHRPRSARTRGVAYCPAIVLSQKTRFATSSNLSRSRRIRREAAEHRVQVRHQQRRRHSFAGDISEKENQLPVARGGRNQVAVIAADDSRGPVAIVNAPVAVADIRLRSSPR